MLVGLLLDWIGTDAAECARGGVGKDGKGNGGEKRLGSGASARSLVGAPDGGKRREGEVCVSLALCPSAGL